MISIVRVLVKLRTIIRNLLHIVSMLALLFPLLTGCEDEEMRHQRQHVASMQKEVTTASRELVAADANARKGWVEAQQSFEQTRSSIVQQQTDVQKGLDRLEAERRDIASERVTDSLMTGTIDSIGTIVACLVPLLLLGWLMQRFWQTETVPEIDELIVANAYGPQSAPVSTVVKQFPPDVEDCDSWVPDL